MQREREAHRREIMSACRALPPSSLNAGLRVQAPKCCRMPSPNSASRQVERFAAIFTEQAFLPEKSENHARSRSIRGWRGEDLPPSETADALDTRHRAGHDACTPPVRTLLCCFGTEKGQEKPDQEGRQERRKQDDAPKRLCLPFPTWALGEWAGVESTRCQHARQKRVRAFIATHASTRIHGRARTRAGSRYLTRQKIMTRQLRHHPTPPARAHTHAQTC